MREKNKFLNINRDLLFCFLVIIIGVIMLYTCKYGFSSRDESFYLTIPYRLIQGDKLIVDEWHPTQFGLSILYPLVSIFLKFKRDTEGIILFFRRLYILINTILTFVVFFLTKKKYKKASYLISTIYLIFCPFSINALSYFSLPYLLLPITSLLLINYNSKLVYLFSGFVFSLCVLCCPYLSIPFFIGSIYILLIYFKDKNNIKKLKRYLCFLCGILITAVLYCVVFFKFYDIKAIVTSLPYIFSDPAHVSNDKLYFIKQYFSFIFHSKYTMLAYVTLFVGMILIKKLNNSFRNLVFSVNLIVIICLIVIYRRANLLLFPFCFIGIFCLIVDYKNVDKDVFYKMWIPGIVYTLCINAASNQGFNAVSCASMLMLMASIIWVFDVSINNCKLNNTLYKLFFILLIIKLSFFRVAPIFENDLLRDSDLIETGSQKGIIAETNVVNDYIDSISSLNKIEKNKSIMFLSIETWMYLETDNKSASLSAWLSGGVNLTTIQRINDYFKIKESYPDYIMIPTDKAGIENKLACYDMYKVVSVDAKWIVMKNIMSI